MSRKLDRLRVQQIDAALEAVKQCISSTRRPRYGWLRAIREGLGMPGSALARRLNVSAPSVLMMEARERDDRISLKTLREAADAMDCDLHYFVVPRKTLAATIHSQAELIAKKKLQKVAHTMALENQPMSPDAVLASIDEQVDGLIANRPRDFWD